MNEFDSQSEDQPPPVGDSKQVQGVRRVVYLVLAGLFFVLGATGAILPGLPTTPFLLLTSYFLLRASPKLNERLLNSRMFGPILTDWQKRGGVRRHVKVKAVIVVLIAVGLMVWLSPLESMWKAVVVGFAAIGLLVVVRLPEITSE